MSLKFSQIILMSQNKEKLVSFLTEIFECTPTPIGDGVCLSHDSLKILIVTNKELTNKELTKEPTKELTKEEMQISTVLDFHLPNLKELIEFKQRLEFWAFRLNETYMFNDIKLIELEHHAYFIVRDPDGRRWKFSTKNIKFPVI